MAIFTVPTTAGAPSVRARIVALVLFLGLWLFVGWLVAVTWQEGEPVQVALLEWLVLPLVVGVIAGWWRGPHTGGAALLPGGLLAALVTLVNLGFIAEVWKVFSTPALDLLKIDWDLPVLLTFVAFLLGSFGALLSSVVTLRITSNRAHQHL